MGAERCGESSLGESTCALVRRRWKRSVELVWVSDARISGGEDAELGGLELLAMAEQDGMFER